MQLNATDIQVNINPIGSTSGIDPVNEPNIVLVSILYLNHPLEKATTQNEFISHLSAPQASNLSSQLTFNLSLSKRETQIFNNYRDKKGFFSLITLDADNNPVHYSITFIG